MKKPLFILLASLPLFLLLFAEKVSAHCPLCTAGAVVAAGGAAYLGVNMVVIGVFIGAFAVSMGLWISKLIKKRYIPAQAALLVLISFLTTILPVMAALPNQEHEVYPLYISISVDYGSFLNRTYLFSKVLIGSLIGGLVTLFTPMLSRLVSRARGGKTLPFQGVGITFLALIITAAIVQVVT